jgi:hypothetical protein
MSQEIKIPFGAQFSPNQVQLPHLLRIIEDQKGNRDKITAAIRDAFFPNHNQNWTLAGNVVIALRDYDLLDESAANPKLWRTSCCKLLTNPMFCTRNLLDISCSTSGERYW